MRRAAQVREDMLRRGTRQLGIDDPGLLPQRCEETLEGPGVPQRRCGPCQLQVVLRRGAVERGEVFAAKHPGERCDRKEEGAALGWKPAVSVWGQRPPGHHTGDMDVVLQGL